jgi:hypothetical protein
MAENAFIGNSTSILQNQITQLSILLQNETEVHQITYSLLNQSRASSQTWENAYTKLLAELDFAYIQLSSAEVKVNQLTNENRRLNFTINRTVRLLSFTTYLG